MRKIGSITPAGSYSFGDQSIGEYSQTMQKPKERFLREVLPLPWQTGEGLPWFEWVDRGIQIYKSGILYTHWERKRRKACNKPLEVRRRFADFLSSAYNCNMTVNIVRIRAKFARDAFEFSLHATDQTILRGISVGEIREAIQTGEIIEDYPDDKYGPSCLILGFPDAGRPLLIQCSYPRRPLIKIVTVYEPDPTEWINYRERR
jgi:hypothetical protein